MCYCFDFVENKQKKKEQYIIGIMIHSRCHIGMNSRLHESILFFHLMVFERKDDMKEGAFICVCNSCVDDEKIKRRM